MNSTLVPQRQSLLADTTEILRQAILTGKWVDRLPGERKLSQQMQIGRDTLRLAIKQLQRERLIGHGEPGKPRKILIKANKDRSRSTTTTGIIGFLTPHPLERLTVTALLEIDKLRQYLHGSGFQLEIANSAKASSLSPSLSTAVFIPGTDSQRFKKALLSQGNDDLSKAAISMKSSSVIERH